MEDGAQQQPGGLLNLLWQHMQSAWASMGDRGRAMAAMTPQDQWRAFAMMALQAPGALRAGGNPTATVDAGMARRLAQQYPSEPSFRGIARDASGRPESGNPYDTATGMASREGVNSPAQRALDPFFVRRFPEEAVNSNGSNWYRLAQQQERQLAQALARRDGIQSARRPDGTDMFMPNRPVAESGVPQVMGRGPAANENRPGFSEFDPLNPWR